MDGVLVDSAAAWCAYYNTALKHFRKKLRLTEEEFRAQAFGRDPADFFASYGFKDALQMRRFVYTNFHHFLDKVKVYPNADFVLSRLKSSGKRLALVSTTPSLIVAELLAKCKLAGYFDVVIGGDEVSKHKPDPEGILKAASLLGVPPRACLYVGDTLPDIEASAAAGTTCVAVAHTLPESELRGARYVIKSLVDLVALVESER
jgi:HAD superfamily hydrolase (TIGR01509 family)